MSAFYRNRLLRFDEISLKTLRQLDRDTTIVMLPLGMLEVHGEHLPLGTDNFAVESLTLASGAWLLDNLPDWWILQMPMMPFGTDPIDTRRPDLFGGAGSISLRVETLHAVLFDVLDRVLQFGFKYVFPLGFHAGPNQSRVLASVCRDLRERYPGRVVYEPMGYILAGAELDAQPGLATLLGRPLSANEQVALNASIHASMFETSMMLYLRPELVDPVYKTLGSIEWHQIYQLENWPGYVGAGPRHAEAQIGAAVLRWRGARAGALVRRAIGGEDLSQLLRHPKYDHTEPAQIPEPTPPPQASVDQHPEQYFSAHDVRELAKKGHDHTLTPTSSTMETRPLPLKLDREETAVNVPSEESSPSNNEE
ncbi:MAG: creatininase family protein [Chloroflexi bacterium]|nr:creatininase family protein [Chloroflexota bacterium]